VEASRLTTDLVSPRQVGRPRTLAQAQNASLREMARTYWDGKRQAKGTMVNIDGQDVLKRNNYDMQVRACMLEGVWVWVWVWMWVWVWVWVWVWGCVGVGVGLRVGRTRMHALCARAIVSVRACVSTCVCVRDPLHLTCTNPTAPAPHLHCCSVDLASPSCTGGQLQRGGEGAGGGEVPQHWPLTLSIVNLANPCCTGGRHQRGGEEAGEEEAQADPRRGLLAQRVLPGDQRGVGVDVGAGVDMV